MNRYFCGLMALNLLLSTAGITKADYTFTTLDVPGSIATSPGGINDSGQIVGGYTDLCNLPRIGRRR
jgi:hypothetical protein